MTDILDPDYESDLTEEEQNRLLLMCGHAVAPPLSPAAQAVLDAFRSSHTGPSCLAAALRAVAEYCVPDDSEGHWVYMPHVLAIAYELEAQ